MKSAMWILVVTAVTFTSVVSAQTDSTSSVPSTGLTATQERGVMKSENVSRAVFTTNVVQREPVDELMSTPDDADTLWFFSEIVDFTGGSITHRWINGGETMAEVMFDIGGPRWRVYSSKILPPGRSGPWTVEIVDGDGNVLRRATLTDDVGSEKPAATQNETIQNG